MSLLGRIRNFDSYIKPLDDFRVKTLSGGLVTLLSGLAIILLCISETSEFLKTSIHEQLFVDSTSSVAKVDVTFDVVFPKLACDFVSIDVMDVSSESQMDVHHDVYRQRLDSSGKKITDAPAVKQAVNANRTVDDAVETTTPHCGSCYGSKPGCCNTCEEVREAYALRGWQVNVETIEQCKGDAWVQRLKEHGQEGCHVWGKLKLAKVAGNFHIAPGDSVRTMRGHVHDLHAIDPTRFDCQLKVNHLAFGETFPGKVYPMDGNEFNGGKGGIMYQFYLKVMPTVYTYLDGVVQSGHQFSVTPNQKDLSEGASGLPGFFVQYEFSPLMIKYEEVRQPLSTFLVSLCAIVGGVYSVAALLDNFIYQSARVFKGNINKLG